MRNGSFGYLFERHGPRVRRLLIGLLGPCDELDDLVQEAFMGAYRSLHQFRGTARFTTWLHRIAVNTALSFLRKPRRSLAVAPVDLDRRESPGDNSEKAVLTREMVRRLYAVLETLSPKRRVALVLFEIEGCSIAEVAAMTGVSPPVAKSRIFFGRRELRKKAGRDDLLGPLLDELGR